MIDTEIIRSLLTPDRANDLLDLLQGESIYSGNFTENIPRTEEQLTARGLAVDHVRFVVKYGFQRRQVIEGHKIYSARPEGFEKWLSMGAPGIEPSELEQYLKDKPI